MQRVIPGKYIGQAKSNSSKSMMQRAVASAILAEGITIINNPCTSDDSKAALDIARSLGVLVSGDSTLTITRKPELLTPKEITSGESGFCARLFPPLLGVICDNIKINGKGTLTKRPMDFMVQPLHELGVEYALSNGKLPGQLSGALKGGNIVIDGSITSQFLSGLLMALVKAKEDSIVQVANLKSKGYIDLTLDVMSKFGVNVEHQNYKDFHIPGNQNYTPCELTIEGDWSGAGFHLVGGAINGWATVKGLQLESKQPDKEILKAIRLAGASISTSADSITATGRTLQGFDFDATDCPDLFPPLAALAANCNGTSRINGVNRLFSKESNRAESIMSALSNVGIQTQLKENTMYIAGGEISGGSIDSKNDHRIAMMGAILAINAKQPIEISNTSSVNKSYRDFFQTLAQFGIQVETC